MTAIGTSLSHLSAVVRIIATGASPFLIRVNSKIEAGSRLSNIATCQKSAVHSRHS